MSWKKTFILGLSSGLLAAMVCIIYNAIYANAFYVNFSQLVKPVNLIAACLFGTFLMAIAYKLAYAFKGEKSFGWLNLVFSLLSFVSIIGVLGFNLPLEIEAPEMFPGLVIPMHFFPALAYLSVVPFFKLGK